MTLYANIIHYSLALCLLSQSALGRLFYIKAITEGCRSFPEFDPQVYLYTIQCDTTVGSEVEVAVSGENLFAADDSVQGRLIVEVPHKEEGILKSLFACETPKKESACKTYSLDVYRVSLSVTSLMALSLDAGRIVPLEPDFDPGVKDYTATIPLGQPWSVIASSKEPHSRVGIEYIGNPTDSGLGNENGCQQGMGRQTKKWQLPASKAVGVYQYWVCSSPFDASVGRPVKYKVSVQVKPTYDVRLLDIDVGAMKLSPAFDPNVLFYSMLIDPTLSMVPVKLRAVDEAANLSVVGDADKVSGFGSVTTAIRMHDNDNLREGDAPKWVSSIKVTVTSPDGETETGYVVSARSNVSQMAELSAINVGVVTVNKKMAPWSDMHKGNRVCDLVPNFSANVTEYKCVFDWHDSEDAKLSFEVTEKHCTRCEIYAPDPWQDSRRHLSLHMSNLPPLHLKNKQEWRRSFLYGEHHTLSVKVVAADRLTHKVYNIYLERWCPWWMSTWVTRLISRTASTLALLMSVSSVTNVMALAKQFQFMALTTKIKDVPLVYYDFASGLQAMNFEIAEYLPNFGLPTTADIKKFEKKVMRDVERNLGIRNGRLLFEYCYALQFHGRSAANAFLNLDPNSAEQLVKDIQVWTKTHDRTKGGNDGETHVKTDPTQGAKPERRLFAQRGVYYSQRYEVQNATRGPNFSPSFGTRGFLARAQMTTRNLAAEKEEFPPKGPDWTWSEAAWATAGRGDSTDLYPDMSEVCDTKVVSGVTRLIDLTNKLHEIKVMLHSTTGTFLICTTILMFISTLYLAYYTAFMKGKQVRHIVLEPGKLILFILDYALVGFTSSCSTVLFEKNVDVTFFYYRPELFVVKAFCAFALIAYPVAFMIGVSSLLIWFINYGELIWNKEVSTFTDPMCNDIRVIVRSSIPRAIPLLPQLATRHVRHCIPVLSQDGEKLDFKKLDENRIAKKTRRASAVDPERLELMQNEQQVNDELATQIKELQQMIDTCRDKEFLMAKLDLKKRELKEAAERTEIEKKLKDDIYNDKEQLNAAKSDDKPFWMQGDHKSTDNNIKKLADLVDSWVPQKGRLPDERLDPEEKFAMLQYIENMLHEEKRLLKYNILKISVKDGYLKPKEPITGLKPSDFWLNDDDYKSDAYLDRLYGHHPNLEEYTSGTTHIESPIGERLIYPGHDNWGTVGRMIPGGTQGATLRWLREPDEGWDQWEKVNISPEKGIRYADKWQWLSMEKLASPWLYDEKGEKTLCCGINRNVFFLDEVDAFIAKFFRGRVPYIVSCTEKIEMRKWIYVQLAPLMHFKLKLGYMADQNSKFAYGFVDKGNKGRRRLVDIVDKSFEEVLSDIMFRKPTDQTKEHQRLIEHELLDFTIAKVEDTYDYSEEPWWEACDKAREGEYRVMFDDGMFWEGPDHDSFKEIRKENNLIARNGYFSSPAFLKHMDSEIGKKYYQITKPDGTTTPVDMSILMRHVMPLMRYTSRFKLNIPLSCLDLPTTAVFEILIGGASQGEEYNYVVDRATTLCIIYILSMKPDGQHCAIAFLSLKFVSYLNQLRAAFFSVKSSDSERGYSTILLEAMQRVDVLVLLLQTITLALLCVGEFDLIPGPLCAIYCIIICSATMIYMNLATFKGEAVKSLRDMSESFRTAMRYLEAFQDRIADILAGDNIYNFQFHRGFIIKRQKLTVADNITFVVPDLGISLPGKPSIDPNLPLLERREMELSKKVAYYVVPSVKDQSGEKLKSVREHPRYLMDILPSLCVALDIDQMLLRREIPQVMAILQCVNHTGSTKFCKTQFDSFCTLFKPVDWDENDTGDLRQRDKIETLMEEWKRQVREWFKDVLGASYSERTSTEEIEREVLTLLEKGLRVAADRDIVNMNFKRLSMPSCGSFNVKALPGRPGRVVVLYESDTIARDFPADRSTHWGKFVEVEGDPQRVELELNDEILVPKPLGVTRVRFVVWAQVGDEEPSNSKSDTNRGYEELVAFTSLQEISSRIEQGEKGEKITLHTRWKAKGLRSLEPAGEQEMTLIKTEKSRLKTLADTLSKLFFKTITCTWFEKDMTPQELEESHGELDVVVRGPTEEEKKNDALLTQLLTDILGGTSLVDAATLKHHKDEWLDLAFLFGIPIDSKILSDMEQHLKNIENIAQGSKEPAENRNSRRKDIIQRLNKNIDLAKAKIEKSRSLFDNKLIDANKLDCRKIGNIVVDCPKDYHAYTSEDNPLQSFMIELLDHIASYQQERLLASKQILHYVMLSDHLKPNANWRPDPISPHVASIVSNIYEDVPEIKVTGLASGRDVFFLRQTKSASMFARKEPTLLNGRLVYEIENPSENELTSAPETDDKLRECFRNTSCDIIRDRVHKVYLYWDGQHRWVISPRRGEPAPYGLEPDKARDFLWAQDNAITPDRITECWHYFGNENKWKRDVDIKVFPRHPKKDGRKNIFFEAQAEDELEIEDPIGAAIKEAFPVEEIVEELKEMVWPTPQAELLKLDPELKECLISLQGNAIQFSWKDDQMSKLAPFRRFLLEHFGTYQEAWMYLTRDSQLPVNKIQQNLEIMFKATHEGLKAAENAMEIWELEEDKSLGERTSERKSTSKKKVVDELEVSNFASTATATTDVDLFVEAVRAKGWDRSLFPKLKDLMTSSKAGGQRGYNFAKLAEETARRMDANDNGSCNIEELHAIFDKGAKLHERLEDFREWLLAHPLYKDIPYFWAALSQGFELTKDEFQKATHPIMRKFAMAHKRLLGSNVELGALMKLMTDSVFVMLDVQMSDSVSLRELIPASGEALADVDKALLHFSVPLQYLSEFKISTLKAKSADKALTISLNPQFANREKWRELRKALNPEWTAHPTNETMTITMRDEYISLWNAVIGRAGMMRQKEWIKYYDGGHEDHDEYRDVVVRSGPGQQRWASGNVYSGEWEAHVYHGQGLLYVKYDDLKSGALPLYDGTWKLGLRYGHGILRWGQLKSRDEATVGSTSNSGTFALGLRPANIVQKRYEGTFVDDLFHGAGKLVIDVTSAQPLPATQALGGSTLCIAPSSTDPSRLIEFTGRFESNWEEVDKFLRDKDARYKDQYREGLKELKLTDFPGYDNETKEYLKKRYFPFDAKGNQKSGAQLPDLAMAFYKHDCNDLAHAVQGRARYLDGCVYEGPFKNKVPHGKGSITRYNVDENGKPTDVVIGRYDGEFAEGKFHGEGKYISHHSTARARSESYEVIYEGGWRDGMRHGHGKIRIPLALEEEFGYASYEGHWEKNLRHGIGMVKVGGDENENITCHGYFYNDVLTADKPTEGNENGDRNTKCWIRLGDADDADTNAVETEVASKNSPTKSTALAVYSPPKVSLEFQTWRKKRSPLRYYYGFVNKDCMRDGEGALFEIPKDSKYQNDLKKFTETVAKRPCEDFVEGEHEWKFTLYKGSWKNNLPDGEGTQCFPGIGKYSGQFVAGQRHGRGTWETENLWKYAPAGDNRTHNWDHDLMHGIAIVEDSINVHENVIYNMGKCQMPFIDFGPPATGFDQTVLIGPMVQRILRTRVQIDDPEKSSADEASTKHKGFGVWSNCERARRKAVTAIVKKGDPNDITLRGEEASPLLRELTDIDMPRDDVVISGGTGENESLNGMYVHVGGNYGLPLYKHVSLDASDTLARLGVASAKPRQHFLWQDTKKGLWVVSDQPMVFPNWGPGTAFVDDVAPNPGEVTKSWYVWDSKEKTMKFGELEDQREEINEGYSLWGKRIKVHDYVTSQSVVGFEVVSDAIDPDYPIHGLFIRNSLVAELYSRPVYEIQTGGQYLYFMLKDGLFEEGIKEQDGMSPGTLDPDVYLKAGHWIISKQLGVPLTHEDCFAYAEDNAVTPDTIDHSKWMCRGIEGFRKQPNLKLKLEMWKSPEDALKAIDAEEDEEEEVYSPLLSPLLALPPAQPDVVPSTTPVLH